MSRQIPLLSLIIPYYNAQPSISALFASIPDDCRLEVVLVNDSSNDGTPDLIASLVGNYSQTQYKKASTCITSGVSHCRNIGIDLASCRFISFLDADDCFTDLSLLLDDLQQKQPVRDVIYQVNNLEIDKITGSIIRRKEYSENLSTAERLKAFLVGQDRSRDATTVWGKIYPSQIVKNSALRFDESLATWEDFLFLCQYFGYARVKRIDTSLRGCYLYYVNPPGTSLTSTGDITPAAVEAVGEAIARFFYAYNENAGSVKHIVGYGLNDMTFIHIMRRISCFRLYNIKELRSALAYCIHSYDLLLPVSTSQLRMFFGAGRPLLAVSIFLRSRFLFVVFVISKGCRNAICKS